MSNYRIIKEYLETLPDNMTISQALSNIKNAEKTLELSLTELEKELSKNVGKCYTYSEIDDCSCVVKYYIKVVGTKRTYKNVAYSCDVIQIEENSIYHEPNDTISQRELFTATEINENVYDMVMDRFKSLTKFKPE
jgi:hypothetical protein